MTGALPSYAVITEGRQHEVTVATTLTFGATTIAAIYNDHWQIELLFKALKQHPKLKTFVWTSATALHAQLLTVLIPLLVLTYL